MATEEAPWVPTTSSLRGRTLSATSFAPPFGERSLYSAQLLCTWCTPCPRQRRLLARRQLELAVELANPSFVSISPGGGPKVGGTFKGVPGSISGYIEL